MTGVVTVSSVVTEGVVNTVVVVAEDGVTGARDVITDASVVVAAATGDVVTGTGVTETGDVASVAVSVLLTSAV